VRHANQKTLFFNLRKAKSKISALEEGGGSAKARLWARAWTKRDVRRVHGGEDEREEVWFAARRPPRASSRDKEDRSVGVIARSVRSAQQPQFPPNGGSPDLLTSRCNSSFETPSSMVQ
jgi:hypothetical protein